MSVCVVSLGVVGIQFNRALKFFFSGREVPGVPLEQPLREVCLGNPIVNRQCFGCRDADLLVSINWRQRSTCSERTVRRSHPGICECEILVQINRMLVVTNAFLQILRSPLAVVVTALQISLVSFGAVGLMFSELL